jgi:hypothetical protein
MHVLADTWAHRYFAGTPSMVINNTYNRFTELVSNGDGFEKRKITFRHSASAPDDLEHSIYTCSLNTNSESSIMNLGHGRAGHMPDYAFIKYKYMPAWGNYKEIIKDNPSDYLHAFAQMVYAMKYLRGVTDEFKTGKYDRKGIAKIEGDLKHILNKRQLNAAADWKKLGEKLSGRTVEAFDFNCMEQEYLSAGETEKENTFLGKYVSAALAQKNMVTNQIYRSGNRLAGVPVELSRKEKKQ